MTSLTEEFLASGATAYPCGNATQAKELLSQVPSFREVKMVSPRATKLRSTLGKRTRLVMSDSEKQVV